MTVLLDPLVVLSFIGAVLLLLMSPGANMAFVVAHGALLGWRGGVAAAAGIATADFLLTVLVALGAGAIVTTSVVFTKMLYVAGAAYLLVLAFRAWKAPVSFLKLDAQSSHMLAIAARSMLNSLLNPKALLFFLVFLPAFTREQHGPISIQILALGFVLTGVAFGFHSGLGVAGALAAGWLRSRTALLLSTRLLCLLFLLLAARLIILALNA